MNFDDFEFNFTNAIRDEKGLMAQLIEIIIFFFFKLDTDNPSTKI